MEEQLVKKFLWFFLMVQQETTGIVPGQNVRHRFVSIDKEQAITPKNINIVYDTYKLFSLRDICDILWYNYYVYDETVGTLMNSMLNSTESIDDLGQALLMIRNNESGHIIFDKYFERKITGWVNAFEVFMNEQTSLNSKVSIF